MEAAHSSRESHENRNKTTKNIKRSKPAAFNEKGGFFISWASNNKTKPPALQRKEVESDANDHHI